MNAAKRRRVPLLTWRDDRRALQILELAPGETYLIGRLPTMSVVIGWDTTVSKLHAKLDCLGDEWVISDDGLSTNGTWVNGERIRESARLRDQDVIRVGTCLFAFHTGAAKREHGTTALEGARDLLPAFDPTDRAILVELCRDYVAHGRPTAVDSGRIAEALGYGVDMVKSRLRDMYKACAIDPANELPRGAKRAELMALVVRHGYISLRDYDRSRGPR